MMSIQHLSQHRGSNASKFPTVFVSNEDEDVTLRNQKLNNESALHIADNPRLGIPFKRSEMAIEDMERQELGQLPPI